MSAHSELSSMLYDMAALGTHHDAAVARTKVIGRATGLLQAENKAAYDRGEKNGYQRGWDDSRKEAEAIAKEKRFVYVVQDHADAVSIILGVATSLAEAELIEAKALDGTVPILGHIDIARLPLDVFVKEGA